MLLKDNINRLIKYEIFNLTGRYYIAFFMS